MSFYDKDKLAKAQAKIRENATPAQNALLREVDAAFDAAAREFDEQIEAETKLRAWAKDLCGVQLDMSEIEELRSECRRRSPGAFKFSTRRGDSVLLIKTAFGTIDRLERYALVLEKTVIDVTNNSQFTPLQFSGLIKLAFKRLFKRSK